MSPFWLNLDLDLGVTPLSLARPAYCSGVAGPFADQAPLSAMQDSGGIRHTAQDADGRQQTIAPAAQKERIDDLLVVEWRHKELWVETRTIVGPGEATRRVETTVLRFSGGVRATFGPSELVSDELELRLDSEERAGLAKGNVRLTDPEGFVECAEMEFQWRAGTGRAKDARVQVGSLGVRAKEIAISPERWLLTNVDVDPNVGGLQVYSLSAPKVELKPGASGFARKLAISLFGKRMIVIPKMPISLRQGAHGIRLPGISLRRDDPPGITWDSDFELGSRTLASASFGAMPGRRPSGSLAITYDLLGRGSGALLLPKSDIGDPFLHGYFDNVGVDSPDGERRATGLRHSTLTVQGSVLQRVTSRRGVTYASKPWEIAFDTGGSKGGFAHSLQVRAQAIQENPGESLQRGVAAGTLLLPSCRLGPSARSVVRLDGRLYLNPSSSFGWARVEAGVVCQATAWLSLGASYSVAGEYGDPVFDFDRVWSNHTAAFRTDLNYGPRSLSVMLKVDTASGKLFDREVAFRQIAGSLAPFVIWRQSPSRFVVGIELRTLDVLDRLKERRRPASREK